jgi:hypothetical protein
MLNRLTSNKKPFLIIGFLFLLYGITFGRDFKNSPYNNRIISFNQGYAFSGRGDCWGIGNEISHLKSFTSRLYHRESLISWLIDGESWIDGGFNHQAAMGATAELGFSLIKMRNRILSLSLGGSLLYLNSRSPYQGGTWTYGNSYLRYVGYRNVDTTLAPGYVMGASYFTQINTRLWLNFRVSFQSNNYFDGASLLSIGLGFDPSKFNK